MQKSFDLKLQRIHEDPSCRDFILADAQDGNMGFGFAAARLATGTDASEADSSHPKNTLKQCGRSSAKVSWTSC